jgi:hypothetical protein
MHRIIWFKVGGRRLHLLKLAGAFILLAAILKVAEAAYWIFVTVQKISYAQMRPDMIAQLFNWGMEAPLAFSNEDVLGVLLGPIANFLFWLALVVVGLMVYQSGKVVFPIEEYEQRVSEYHKELIRRAVAAHKKRR